MTIDELISDLKKRTSRTKSDLMYLMPRVIELYNSDEQQLSVLIENRVIRNIIFKTQQELEKILETEKPSILHLTISVRYFFEQLIILKQLEKDRKLFYQLKYATYLHQIDKTEKTIFRLKNEIFKLKEFAKKEKEQLGQLDDQEKIEKLKSELLNEESEIYHLFTEGTKKYGFENLANMLEAHILSNELDLLNRLKREKDDFENKLINDEELNKFLNLNKQKSKISKTLKKRNERWVDKAESVGLSDEYKLIYDFTGASAHFTAYSHQTTPFVNQNEYLFFFKILQKTVEQIELSLNKITGTKLVKKNYG